MSPYLTPDELADLTDARSRKTQEKWLQSNGFVFVVSVRGHIKVLRTHHDAMMGLRMARPVNDAGGPEPDFSVFQQSV